MTSTDSDKPAEKPAKRFLPFMPIVFSMILAGGVVIGYFLSARTFAGKPGSHHTQAGNSRIDNLLDYIEMQYVDTINRESLETKTIISMLKSLDPHSDFIPASEFNSVNEPLEGNFDGIGVEFNIINDTIRVINPIIGGPSEKIGIKAGDKIINVNGKNVAGVKITNKQVFEKLRGKRGTTVNVTIVRHPQKKTTLVPYNPRKNSNLQC